MDTHLGLLQYSGEYLQFLASLSSSRSLVVSWLVGPSVRPSIRWSETFVKKWPLEYPTYLSTSILKLSQNSKTLIVTKLWKLKLWQNSKTQIVTKFKNSIRTKLKNSSFDKSKTQIVTKLKNQIVTKPKNSNCYKNMKK